jgi:hypothetical protein
LRPYIILFLPIFTKIAETLIIAFPGRQLHGNPSTTQGSNSRLGVARRFLPEGLRYSSDLGSSTALKPEDYVMLASRKGLIIQATVRLSHWILRSTQVKDG